MTTLDSLHWEPLPAALFQGTPPVDTTSSWRYARLKGDPLKRGAPFTVAVRCTDGSRAAPHWHPLEENIVVVKGTFALATGDTFDARALRDLSAGSYVFMPKRLHHFALCRGETVLVEYGVGPLEINFVSTPKGRLRNQIPTSEPEAWVP
jgi:hypothetical protein